MDILLEKKEGLPYYVQLKNILRSKIQSGEWKSRRIPPVRQVAKELGISINTVLRAYTELKQEGILTGAVGKGTFITTTPQDLKKQNRQTLLKKVIEHALEEALSLEFTLEEFEQAVHGYVKEKLEMIQKVRLSFIECNIEQLLYFTNHLELDPHIQRIPILLEDLKKADQQTMEEISNSDIVVTTFHHLDEIRDQFSYLAKPIVGISLEPEMSTIIRIAKIPPESTVGIVTTSCEFRKIIREVLEELNLSFSNILETNSKSNETVRRVVHNCDIVLVSPRRKQIAESLVKEGTPVIEFILTPDRTSINNLKVALVELRNGKF